MSDFKIYFESTIPKSSVKDLRKLFAKYTYILEREIRILRVGLKGARSDVQGEAATLTMRQYNWASIALDPEFFTIPDDEQERTVAHEVIHVLHDIFSDEVNQVLLHFVPENARPFVEERLECCEERVVDTLGNALYETMRKR